MSLVPGAYRRSSKREPCPICGKPDGCIVFNDGRGAACLRVESGHQTPNGWWYHRLGDQTDDWRDHLPNVNAAPPAPVADGDLCDRAYRALLRHCPLTEAHRDQLRQRGMGDDEIARNRYGTLPEHGREELAALVIAEVGADLLGKVPGFYRRQGRPAIHGLPGLLIPVQGVDDAIQRLRVSPDDPTKRAEGKYRWISSADLDGGVGSGTAAHFAFPEMRRERYARAGATEGEFKAAIAARVLGMPFLSMPGVGAISALKQAISGLRKLGVREIVMAFDLDAATNPMVASGLKRAMDFLESEGFAVLQLTWPSAFKGLDDALVRGVMPMIERRVAVEHADVFEENARLKAENAELRAKIAGQAGDHAAYVQAQRAPHLGPERQVAAAVINSLSAAKASGADEWVRMPYAKVADAAGVSERAVPRHFKKLMPVLDDHVELKTEWAPDLGHKITVARLKTSSREALLAVAAAKPESGHKNGNGGRREPCPVCGDVGVTRVSTDFCLGCGAQIASHETHIAPGSRQTVMEGDETVDAFNEPSARQTVVVDAGPPSHIAAAKRRIPLEYVFSPAKMASFHNRDRDEDDLRLLPDEKVAAARHDHRERSAILSRWQKSQSPPANANASAVAGEQVF